MDVITRQNDVILNQNERYKKLANDMNTLKGAMDKANLEGLGTLT